MIRRPVSSALGVVLAAAGISLNMFKNEYARAETGCQELFERVQEFSVREPNVTTSAVVRLAPIRR